MILLEILHKDAFFLLHPARKMWFNWLMSRDSKRQVGQHKHQKAAAVPSVPTSTVSRCTPHILNAAGDDQGQKGISCRSFDVVS